MKKIDFTTYYSTFRNLRKLSHTNYHALKVFIRYLRPKYSLFFSEYLWIVLAAISLIFLLTSIFTLNAYFISLTTAFLWTISGMFLVSAIPVAIIQMKKQDRRLKEEREKDMIKYEQDLARFKEALEERNLMYKMMSVFSDSPSYLTAMLITKYLERNMNEHN